MKIDKLEAEYKSKGIQKYIFWEAHPHNWSYGCWVLMIQWKNKQRSGSILAYFYTNPEDGPSLVDVIQEYKVKCQ